MASSPKETPKEARKALEGIFAINKPQYHSSAGLLRDLQTHFQTSSLFTPWLDSARRHLILSGGKKRNIQNLKVKLGHGGTLDPMATGVLIVGVGKGTKALPQFLECTKTYETVVLFGAATDSYDAVGKVVAKGEYKHVTKELLEEKLKQFRGEIMQKPSVFSALKVNGKTMYELARAGEEIPDVPARKVEAKELELVEWLEPGTHDFKWPGDEVEGDDKAGAERILGIRAEDARHGRGSGRKRSRSPSVEKEDGESGAKKPRTDSEAVMSGALPVEPKSEAAEAASTVETASAEAAATETPSEPRPSPPAARLRMTVTSGFYVRSLCHDLGLACNSYGLMSSLVRSRQGDYELGKNVLEYSELEAGPEVWEPKVKQYLEEYMEKEGWEAEEVEDEDSWQANKKEREKEFRAGEGAQTGKPRGNYSKGKNGNWRGGKRN